MQCVKYCNDPAKAVYFDQPVLQTLQMFVGEMSCWIVVYLMKLKTSRNKTDTIADTQTEIESPLVDGREAEHFIDIKRRPGYLDSIILAIPSTCDLLGTTLMNIGLLYTPVSIYQMTRGSVILIVGLMSVIFLKHKITKLEWVSLFVVFFGVFLVGLSGYIQDQEIDSKSLSITDKEVESSLDVIIGMVLVFMGIIMTAVQFVVEEHILTYLDIEPIEVVGYEGTYGSLVTLIGMNIGYVVYGKGYFNIYKAFFQMIGNSAVLYSSVFIMLSIAIFNICGITVTKIISATSRSTIDTSRTLLVWIISLALGWESFHSLQLIAFTLLVLGTLSFNGVIQPQYWRIIPEWLKELETETRT